VNLFDTWDDDLPPQQARYFKVKFNHNTTLGRNIFSLYVYRVKGY